MAETWDETRLLRYVDDEVEESLNLEYKAADALGRSDGKKAEITKDVSAMANSDGGILIYGVAEKPETKHLPARLDPVTRHEFSKEWLEQVIANIRPRVDGLAIRPVTLSSGRDHVVYVVEVPRGSTAHQAKDKRYYMRYNFESTAMEDYQVRDVMGRGQFPKLEVTCRIVRAQFPQPAKLLIEVTNVGMVYARYVHAQIRIPRRLDRYQDWFEPSSTDREVPYRDYSRENIEQIDSAISGQPLVKMYRPILPGLGHTWSFRLANEFQTSSAVHETTKWTIYADNAPPVFGEVEVKDIPHCQAQP